jgi:general secretion pathway protein L
MAEHLFIAIDDHGSCSGSVVLDANGHLIQSPGAIPLTALGEFARERTLHVLVPSAAVISTTTELPRANAARLRQLLPFAMEDELAEDIETMHFASGKWQSDNSVTVAAATRQRMAGWLDSLREAGLQPIALHSIADGVPDTPGTIQLMLDGPATLGRCAGAAPFNRDSSILPDVLDVLRDSGDANGLNHIMIHAAPETLAERKSEIDALRDTSDSLDVRALADGALPHLAQTLLTQGGTNLLQGEFAPRSNLIAMAKPWRTAAGLAAAALLLAVLAEGLILIKLHRDDNALTAQAAEICAADYSSAELNRCRTEMQRRLSQAGQASTESGAGFLGMLATVAEAVGNGAALEALSYRNSVLDLEVVVADVTALDALSQQVSSSGRFSVRLLTNTPEAEGLKSRIQVVEGSP